MAFYFTIIMCIYIVNLTLFSATNGSTRQQYEYADEEDEDERLIFIPGGSQAEKCLTNLMRKCIDQTVCYVVVQPTKYDCAARGVLYWRDGTNAHEHVRDYFDFFRHYLIPGDFLLPDAYCSSRVPQNMTNSNQDQQIIENVEKECKDQLYEFRGLVIPPDDDHSNVFEAEQLSKKRIIMYAFYETSLSFFINKCGYSFDSHIVSYLFDISNTVKVAKKMANPKRYCAIRFPLTTEEDIDDDDYEDDQY